MDVKELERLLDGKSREQQRNEILNFCKANIPEDIQDNIDQAKSYLEQHAETPNITAEIR